MGLLNKIFFNLGFTVASNPCTACFFALMFMVVCSLGFINFSLTVLLFYPNNVFIRMIPRLCGFLQILELIKNKHTLKISLELFIE
jgi:hypothetical protein